MNLGIENPHRLIKRNIGGQMKSYTEQTDTSHISAWKNPKSKVCSKWIIAPDIEIFPLESNLAQLKRLQKKVILRKMKKNLSDLH